MSFYRVALTTTKSDLPIPGMALTLDGAEANAKNIGSDLSCRNVVTFPTRDRIEYISAIHVVRWWVEVVPAGELSVGDAVNRILGEDESQENRHQQ